MPSIYVGTYGKYNAGSIEGKWLDLEDYADKDAFLEACQDFHGPGEHEWMFQDHEGIPSQFITECSIKSKFWDYMDSDIEEGVKDAYMYLFDEWDEERCLDRYRGEFRSPTELAEDYVESTGMLHDLPDNLQYYFDYEAFGRDMMLDGMSEHNGHYFYYN